MKSAWIMRGMIGFYIFLFFLYLFGPLLVMSVTAFNTPSYPQAYPFEAFTLDWFVKLWNDRAMMEGLQNSVIIGIGVIAPERQKYQWLPHFTTVSLAGLEKKWGPAVHPELAGHCTCDHPLASRRASRPRGAAGKSTACGKPFC